MVDIKTKFNMLVAIGLVLMLGCLTSVYLADVYLSDVQNTFNTKITGGNGGVWEPTLANVQTAIYANDNATNSWVHLPTMNITVTTTIWLTANVDVGGSGKSTIFWLCPSTTAQNVTVFKNYGWKDVHETGATGITNLHLHDFVVDGNQYHQIRWVINDGHFHEPHIGLFQMVNNSKFENIEIRNSLWSFVFVYCNDISMRNFKGYHLGNNWTGITYPGESSVGYRTEVMMAGLEYDSCYNTTTIGCHFIDLYSIGVCYEDSTANGVARPDSENHIISSCIFDTAFVGIWVESGSNVTITSCLLNNITKIEAYKATNVMQPKAIFFASGCMHSIASGNLITNSGNVVGKNGTAIAMYGNNNSAIGNTINHFFGNGTKNYGVDCKIIANTITDVSCYGIHSITSSSYPRSGNPTINSNVISRTGTGGSSYQAGIQISHATSTWRYNNKMGTCVGNTISYAGIWGGTSGYGIFNYLSNMTIDDNTIYHCDYGIYTLNTHLVSINSNHMSYTYRNGIYLAISDNNTINDNIINKPGQGTATSGIYLLEVKNCTLEGNNVKGATSGGYAIGESSSVSDCNIFLGNNVYGNTANVIQVSGAHSIKEHNLPTTA